VSMLFQKRYKAKCGHKTVLKGKVEASGKHVTTTMPKNNEGSTDYCLECLGKMAIRCAWCGDPIFIGDAVTLYSPTKPNDVKMPEHAVVHDEIKGRKRYVGCLGWNCAETGGDRAGFWP